ncbi:outer membrane beta-barrel protein [Polaribacter reichenbachii]|uniref:Uncharacterized protein n=1 Tax=Polaribacter reichenbachii TaxID=996801 RepID=A0A1B8U0F7_9FLAO|nr:outer membrane beta-barrel protein [Polaribacter reichenbachii]OBY65302.1 hypothetical protein LPB301_09375 [Polaribacter reichenbachii]
MKLKTTMIILFLGLNSLAQIKFEKGYFITNNGQKIEGLIKNNEWLQNPNFLIYKKTIDAEQKKLTLKEVKGFGVYGSSKYIKAIVNIDKSSKILKELNEFKEPKFEQEEIFLKVLIEGDTNLYSYKNGNLVRFFFNKNNSEIEQLIFKKYKTTEGKIAINDKFKQQLWVSLKCENISFKTFKNLDYKEQDLIHFFERYYNCMQSEYISFKKNKDQDLFNLTLRAGLNNSSLKTGNNTFDADSPYFPDFGNQLGLRLGVELEFIMPFNKNKWGFIIEPTYQSYKADVDQKNSTSVDYSSIELPIGVRHYFFLNNSSKLYINGSIIIDFSNGELLSQEIQSSSNFGFGVGFKSQEKYSIEFRYHTNRDLFNNYLNNYSEYKTMSIIFGYTIF